MKRMILAAVAFLALSAGVVVAEEELPDKPISQHRNMQNLCRSYECGQVVLYNQDWVPLTFNYDRLPDIHVGYGTDTRTPGDMLNEGESALLTLPAGRYRLIGEGGETVNVSAFPHQSGSLTFKGVRRGGEYGVVAIHKGVTGTSRSLLMGYRDRAPYELPPAPPPPPEPVHHNGWFDGGNGPSYQDHRQGWGGGYHGGYEPEPSYGDDDGGFVHRVMVR